MLLAMLLRLTSIRAEIPILQGDECEYRRIAANLLREHRYAGLHEGPQLVYPPLFPLLIAQLSLVTPSLAASGMWVPFLGGLALVAATYALARESYGRSLVQLVPMLALVALIAAPATIPRQGLSKYLVQIRYPAGARREGQLSRAT